MMYPTDCIQTIVGHDKWWEKQPTIKPERGCLAFSFIPHVDQLPYCFEPVGRLTATDHANALVKVSPLKVDQPLKPTALPVAAMTLHDGEVWAAYRAKKRPCLILNNHCPAVQPELAKGMPSNSTAQTLIVAPYYGVKRNNHRAGYKAEFVECVRHCQLPQFVWDMLPFSGGEESILRLDHMQPIGGHYGALKLSGYKLSSDAMAVLDELLSWVIWGGVPEDSLVAMYRSDIEATFV
jgi:hypothetical protein